MTHLRSTAVLLAAAALAAGCAATLAVPEAERSPWHVAAPPPPGFDRSRAQARTREHLVRLVAIDTTNPPGNERRLADDLQAHLAALPGMQTTIVDVGEGRANLLARLPAGAPTARPVIVMAHMDVVGADPAAWSTPPLQATEVDGYLQGRGVMDDKGMLAATLVALEHLAPRRASLRRDVILLATAAEEGGPEVGIVRLLAEHRELLGDAEFALNEGGRIRVRDGAIVTVNVQTTEKVPYDVTVTARGPSGHGSVPLPDNALAALARAVAALHEWRAPVRLNATTRLYFERRASIESDPVLRAAMQDLLGDDPDARERAVDVLAAVPTLAAVLRAGQSLTLLGGGFRTNVIPSEGTANFNLRVLPDDDVQALVADMARAVAHEPAVTVALVGEPKASPPPSPVDSELFAAMERAAADMAPGALVIPFMSTGATDGAALRAAGIPTYGILPFPMVEADELRMHGDDERVPLPSLGWAAEFVTRTLLAVAGPPD